MSKMNYQRVETTTPQEVKNKYKKWLPFALVMAVILLVTIIGVGVYHHLGTEKGAEPFSSGKKNVEVIAIEGEIKAEGDKYNQEWINKRIQAAQNDRDNQGIVLKINSPGGTVYESDETYLHLLDYKEKTKRPVYAYCEHLCASGGYYIASAADEIYTNRNSFVGSIGVISGRFVDATGLLDKLGIKVTTIHTGANKLMGHPSEPPTPEQLAIMQRLGDEAYEQFVGIVAKGRHMDINAVKALADGRIYSGKQAKDNGLVDKVATPDEFKKAMKKKFGEDITVYENPYQNTKYNGILKHLSKSMAAFSSSSELQNTVETIQGMTITEPMYLYQTN